MTIKELIEELSKLDPNLHVFVEGYEGGFSDIVKIDSPKEYAMNFHSSWWYGKHEDIANIISKEVKETCTFSQGVTLMGEN
jgi:hypothetical protein